MRRIAPHAATVLLGVAAAIAAGAARAQPRPAIAPAFAATVVGPDLPAGLDVGVPVRIADARSDAPVMDARVSAARLVSPFGAALPVQPPPSPGGALGVRLFRADLLAPGAWTLEFTVASPGRAAERETVGFTVAAPAAQATAADPTGVSAAAAGSSVSPLGPVVAASGLGAPSDGGATAPPGAASRTAGGAPPAATQTSPFCAECASEAPH